MISAEEVLAALKTHTNVLLYGPPGTGKSHLMKQVENLFRRECQDGHASATYLIDSAAERDAISEASVVSAHTRWVTFHQGYSYEDFVVGIRPTGGTGGGSLVLEARAGALVELAAYSQQGQGLMLIDEINRGNVSRIFGEFITLMEADKRLKEDGSPSDLTVTVTLPYLAQDQEIKLGEGVTVKRQFAMPLRLYTLASMNSVDKSIAPIDSAIRRRFFVVNLHPTRADLEDAAGVKGAKSDVAKVAANLLHQLNRSIGIHLGPDYMLGQYYLPVRPKLGEMDEAKAKKQFTEHWRHRILPQILDLLQARPAVCELVLDLGKDDENCGLELVRPSEAEVEEGATGYIVKAATTPSDEETYSYLKKLASGEERSESTQPAEKTGGAEDE